MSPLFSNVFRANCANIPRRRYAPEFCGLRTLLAKAKVSKADGATLAKLKEERLKEDQKLMRDPEHRLALIRRILGERMTRSSN